MMAPAWTVPTRAEVVQDYWAPETAEYGGLMVAGLPGVPVAELVVELATAQPDRPVDLSLIVDTGLKRVPKALSMVMSGRLVTARTVETGAPNGRDAQCSRGGVGVRPEEVLVGESRTTPRSSNR